MSRLTAHGELANTVAVFTSDNGFLWGEHGMHSKFNPYTPSIGVPLLVRWPGRLTAGRSDDRLVGNVDLAPSLLAAAGITVNLKYPFDGRPFLTASGLAAEKRPEVYLEYFEDEDRRCQPTSPATAGAPERPAKPPAPEALPRAPQSHSSQAPCGSAQATG